MKNKMYFLKGALCGFFISITINASIIYHFFFDMTGFSTSLFPILAGIITLIFLISNTYKKFIASLIISLVAFIFGIIAIRASGITLYFFQFSYGAGAMPWAGDGMGMLLSFILCISGGVIGAFAALIVTGIRKDFPLKAKKP